MSCLQFQAEVTNTKGQALQSACPKSKGVYTKRKLLITSGSI